jgi:hypothetical protein
MSGLLFLTGTDFGNGGGGGGVSDGNSGGGGGASDDVGGLSVGGGGSNSVEETDDADVRCIDGIGGGSIKDDADDAVEDDKVGVIDFLIPISPVSRRASLLTILIDGSDKTLIAVDDGVELCISFILTLGVALSGTVDNEKTDDAFDGVVCFDKTGVILGVMLLLDFSLIFIGVTGTRGDGILTFDTLEDDDAISLNISLLGLAEVDNVDGADETSDNDDNFSLRDGFELELDAILGLGDGADDTSENTGGVNTFFEDVDD